MPFLSPDWRYPGDRWLRSTECGSLWENAKIYRLHMFERMNESVVKRACRRSLQEQPDAQSVYDTEFLRVMVYQPHVRLKSVAIREVGTTTTISEALLNLDMKAAIRDVRRFDYVCRVIQLLLIHHFHKLTGRLQMFLIELLRTIFNEVKVSCNQTALFKQLLVNLTYTLEVYKYNHLGSAPLWENHRKAVEQMSGQLSGFDIEKNMKSVAAKHRLLARTISESGASTTDCISLEKLPPECLAHVVSFLNCPRDLETASLASGAISDLVESDYIWRHLTLSYFDMDQMSAVHFGRVGWRNDPPATIDDCNWRRTYLRLLKRYGNQHFYSAKLAVCETCNCLFWPIFGHPCQSTTEEPHVRLLSPEDFIALFEI